MSENQSHPYGEEAVAKTRILTGEGKQGGTQGSTQSATNLNYDCMEVVLVRQVLVGKSDNSGGVCTIPTPMSASPDHYTHSSTQLGYVREDDKMQLPMLMQHLARHGANILRCI